VLSLMESPTSGVFGRECCTLAIPSLSFGGMSAGAGRYDDICGALNEHLLKQWDSRGEVASSSRRVTRSVDCTYP
jgi:hypothetical protein